MLKRGLRLLALVAACCAGAPLLAQEAPRDPPPLSREERAKRLDAVLADLSKRLGSMRTLRARFVQKKYLEVFEDVVTSEGTLALAVPGRLRWEYVRPVRSVLVVNGPDAQRERTSRKGETTRKVYALDDEPITAITAQQVFLWSLGDFARARQGYDLELVSEKPLVVRASPKDERVRNVVTSIDLTFADDRRALIGVSLREKSKAKTDIVFVDVEIDPALPDALFRIAK